MVGEEAFQSVFPLLIYRKELEPMVRIGQVDLMGVPPKRTALSDFLVIPKEEEVPLIPVEGLILMKLDAGRLLVSP